MDEQDWTPVTVHRRGANKGAAAKTGAGSSNIVNRAHVANSQGSAAARKLEETDIGKPKQLSTESRNEITQRRVSLGKNQVELNQLCNFPVNTVRDIESGRFCPSPGQLSILNRVLKSSLKYET